MIREAIKKEQVGAELGQAHQQTGIMLYFDYDLLQQTNSRVVGYFHGGSIAN